MHKQEYGDKSRTQLHAPECVEVGVFSSQCPLQIRVIALKFGSDVVFFCFSIRVQVPDSVGNLNVHGQRGKSSRNALGVSAPRGRKRPYECAERVPQGTRGAQTARPRTQATGLKLAPPRRMGRGSASGISRHLPNAIIRLLANLNHFS